MVVPDSETQGTAQHLEEQHDDTQLVLTTGAAALVSSIIKQVFSIPNDAQSDVEQIPVRGNLVHLIGVRITPTNEKFNMNSF